MKKTAAIATAIAVTGLALATWASPHWQLYRMRAAAEARDARTLSGYVDFPKLRRSVKAQLMRRLGADGAPPRPRSAPFAAFGRTLGLAVVDPVVDAAVSPAGVAAMLETGGIRVRPGPDAPPAAVEARPGKRNFDLSYRSWNQVVLERADGGGVAFVLEREGWWRWKLAGVELREE